MSYALAVALALGAVSAGAQTPAPATHPDTTVPCDADSPMVWVNGAEGTVTFPSGLALFKPGEAICVGVYKANLISYRYTLEVADQLIEVVYPIEGAGAAIQGGTHAATLRATAAASRSRPTTPAQFADEVDRLQSELEAARKATAALAASVAATEAGLPVEIDRLCPGGTPTPCTEWSAAYFNVDAKSAVDAVAQADATLTTLQAVVNLNAPADLLRPAASPWKDQIGKASELLKTAATDINLLTAAVVNLRARVERWRLIITLHPTPVVRMGYRLKRGSRRYVATVSRTPYEAAAAGPPPTPSAPGAPSTAGPVTLGASWSFTFEGHERARFALAVGVAGVYKHQDRNFALVDSIDAESKVVHTVQETSGPSVDSKPFATLGIYLGPRVDTASDTRKPKLAVILGSELKTSPDSFLVGLALDFAGGLQLSLGGTHYRTRELAPGWTTGRVVKDGADGKPLVAAPPTIERGGVAVFVGVAFRPAIFKAFRDLVKGD